MQFVALESLKFGANMLPKSFKKSRKSIQGCRRGGQNRSQWVPPQRFRKTGRKQTHYPRKVLSNWLQNGSPNLKVWRIVVNMFRCVSASLLRWIFNGFWIDFRRILWRMLHDVIMLVQFCQYFSQESQNNIKQLLFSIFVSPGRELWHWRRGWGGTI